MSTKRFARVFQRFDHVSDDEIDLVIAVHGMGDQGRNDMAQTVAAMMARSVMPKDGGSQAIQLPRGLWEGSEADDPIQDDVIGFVPTEHGPQELKNMAFAEVYWADVLRKAEKAGHRIEDSPKWAGSVVDRLRQRHDLKPGFDFSQAGLALGAMVVEEIAESLRILNNLLLLADKAGIFRFDLGKITEQYLGDVQQVADFRYIRDQCLDRFFARMQRIHSRLPKARIHFIAHSEGSVLCFYALLHALKDHQRGKHPQPWIENVISLTTFGSPIDKHLILWPEMWGWLSYGEERITQTLLEELRLDEAVKSSPNCPECPSLQKEKLEAAEMRQLLLEKQRSRWFQPTTPIRWRNYYDLADPVGYDLDTARQKLALWGCEAFEFDPDKGHDTGFRRYPFAGKAHVDYFGDLEFFRHVRQSAIEGRRPPRLGSGFWGRCSIVWPWLIVGALHLAAMLALHRGMAAEGAKQVQVVGCSFLRYLFTDQVVAWLRSYDGLVACALMLIGVTAWSRASSILGKAVLQWGTLTFVACSAMAMRFASGLPEGLFVKLLVVPSLTMVAIGLLTNRLATNFPVWALRWQMMTGGGLLGVAVIYLFRNPETSMLSAVSGAAAFMFLWWLAALLFDLVYVWGRYINWSKNTFLDLLRPKMAWHAAASALKRFEEEGKRSAQDNVRVV